MTVTVRPARPGEEDVIAQWRRHAAAWIAETGSDQWSDATGLARDAFVDRVRGSIEAGETWVAEVDGVPAATIALDQWCNPGMWSENQLAESVIVHRMITAPGYRGHGLGGVLLEHADAVAREKGLRWVRLDAWSTNERLHDYYRAAGFRFVRWADHRTSGALFERPVTDLA